MKPPSARRAGPRRVVVDGPEELRIEQGEPMGSPERGHARLRSLAIGICGSDLHVLAGHHPFVTYPVFPGHEVVARIDAVGSERDGHRVGARVVLEPSLACGACRACRRGDYNVCDTLRVMGFQAPGGMADRFDAPLDRLHLVPDDLSDDAAALVEPTAVATHALRLAALASDGGEGAEVAVIGAGTIGLLVAQAARAYGADVTVLDVDAERRALAGGLGFVSTDALEPRSYDRVFECVGVEHALRAAVAAARKGGSVMVVGVHGRDAHLQAGLIQDFELRMQGVLMYTAADYHSAMALLQDGSIAVDSMISARVPLADVVDGYALARSGGGVLKVLLVP